MCATVSGKTAAERVVYCWGENYWGSAGRDAPSQITEPTAVPGVTDAVRVATGHGHSCTVTGGGAVWCWGHNHDGQLGDGTKCGNKCTKPVKVVGIEDALLIAAGGDRTCATRAGGTLWCWGDNTGHLLGTGSQVSKVKTPERVGTLRNIASIAVSEAHVCAADTKGVVRCWGKGGKGELGDGKKADSETPLVVPGAALGELAANLDHACGLAKDGAVWCWGENDLGEIGPKAADKVVAKAKQSWALAGVQRLDAGHYSVCMIGKTGVAYCVGEGTYGKLGRGTSAHSDVPVPVKGSGG